MTEKNIRYKRLPAVTRKISEIDPQKDIRIRLFGRVIDTTDSAIVLDDGTGRAEVVLESSIDENITIARVFARVLPLETGYELRAEIVQGMNDVDEELYRKIMVK